MSLSDQPVLQLKVLPSSFGLFIRLGSNEKLFPFGY